MPYSHARRLLSSDVVMKRRFSSQNVMVLTGPRWWSYSCSSLPERVSNWTIFLSAMPARNWWLSAGSGLKRTTCGVLPVEKRVTHWPVSVSQSFICRSYDADRNRVPSLLKHMSLTDLLCPM